MPRRKFNHALSLKIDAAQVAIEEVRRLPNTPVKVRKLLILRSLLKKLERKI